MITLRGRFYEGGDSSLIAAHYTSNAPPKSDVGAALTECARWVSARVPNSSPKGVIVAASLVVVVLSIFLIEHFGKSEKPDSTQQNEPSQTEDQIAVGTSGISSVEDVRKYAVGIWTYTGLEAGGLWLRLVIHPDGSCDHQIGDPVHDDWEKPSKGTWEAVSRKYNDTGRRWYGLDTSRFSTLILKTRTEMLHINLKVTLTKGDKFPFSK